MTTNVAGVLSPYGEFFPTQAGQAALVTMPDIDTGQQGTSVVDVVSLNVDANHDDTMDFKHIPARIKHHHHALLHFCGQ